METTLPADPAPAASVSQVPTLQAWRDPRIVLLGAWLVTLAVLAGLGWTAVARRADIMHAWPPSMRAYAAVGLIPTHH